MQATSIQFSPAKDGRRILGEKDANACLSPARQSKQALAVAGTPVKRTLFTTASPKKLLPSPIFAGQKRTRDQVDESDVNSRHVQEARGHRELCSQPTLQTDDKPQNSETDAMDMRHSTLTRSERDQTPDQMDADTASQDSVKRTRTIPEDPDARKVFIQQKATLLRNRLQTAMRNVTDHQIDRRVSELEAHSRKCPRIPLSAFSSSPLSLHSTTTPSQFRTPRIGMAADLSSTLSQETPDLPRRRSPMSEHAARAKTSHRTPPRTRGSPMQLSSPPATVVRLSRNCEVGEEQSPAGEAKTREDLSPSQRGDAVDGLLKLMSTTNRNDSSDVWSG